MSPLLAMRDISKAFAGVSVLKDVSFSLEPGEIHILAGENGAGKSTLMKILAGVHTEFDGEILIEGKPARFASPLDANRAGVAVIYQEMSLIGSLSVVDNLFLGRERTRAGWLRHSQQTKEARELLKPLGLDIDVRQSVNSFPIPVRQLIEIGKALSLNARILVMDEPTSALAEPEVERLFELIAQLKAQGCGIVYISHKMQEIYRLADRITVLRDGRHVATDHASQMPAPDFVRFMVGRDLSQQFPRRERQPDPTNEAAPRIVVVNLSLDDPAGTPRKTLDHVSFRAEAGEILGLAGLQGSGISEALNALFGTYGPLARGTVQLDGKPYSIRSPRHAVAAGIALLTNDRKENGCVLGLPITQNISLATMPKFSPGGWIRQQDELRQAQQYMKSLRIRASSPGQEVNSLSGGNQQKVILAKWLETKPRLLLLDEPTRGVDVGAKHEIYELIHEIRAGGCTVLLVTTEMPELLALADRILVFHRGSISAELAGATATQETILKAAMGDETVDSHTEAVAGV